MWFNLVVAISFVALFSWPTRGWNLRSQASQTILEFFVLESVDERVDAAVGKRGYDGDVIVWTRDVDVDSRTEQNEDELVQSPAEEEAHANRHQSLQYASLGFRVEIVGTATNSGCSIQTTWNEVKCEVPVINF